MDENIFSLDQLCTLTALPKRTVRYYIQIGLMPRPVGENRGAKYFNTHLDTLLRIKQLSEAGVSLERIGEVLAGGALDLPTRQREAGSIEVRTSIFIAPGVELVLSPEQSGASPEQVRALARSVLKAWNQIQKEPT